MPAVAHDVRNPSDPAKSDRSVDLGSRSAWWALDGPRGALHLLNEIRVPYFERVLGGYSGKRILDVGCGGGVFSEALARAGADVLGIDASERSLETAREHAREAGLEIDYRLARAEDFKPDRTFDVVAAVNVLEHVEDVNATLDMCASALKPGGVFGFLTHNQTLDAFEKLIWQGEYEIGLIRKGTHDFHKFLNPDDLAHRLALRELRLVEIRGIGFDLSVPAGKLIDSVQVSYIGYAIAQ
jgi:2-polyprenyl-6-hydroxyphenyl methylase/3-demethylubiquinone-9 3-methyltransferase